MNLAADQEYFLRLKQELDAFKDFARDNFGIIVTGFYFVVSVAGLVYLNVLLDEFNVNVFHHIELSDYLLAALSNNNLIIVYLAFCFLMFLYNRWKTKHIPAVKKDTWYNRFYYQVFGFLYRLPALKTQLAGFFLTLLFYAYQSGLNRADSIHQGFGDSYEITLNYPVNLHEKESLYLSEVSIVTSTTSNLFIYDKAIDKLIIIPHANIAMLLPKRKLNTSKDDSGKEKSSS